MKKLLTLGVMLATILLSACGPDNNLDHPDGNDPNEPGDNYKTPTATYSYLMDPNDPSKFMLGPHGKKIGLIQGKDFVATNSEGVKILKCLIGTEADPTTRVRYFSISPGYSQEAANMYAGDEPGKGETFWTNINCPATDSLIFDANNKKTKILLDQAKGVFVFPPFAEAEMTIVELVTPVHAPHASRWLGSYSATNQVAYSFLDWKAQLILPYANNKEISHVSGN